MCVYTHGYIKGDDFVILTLYVGGILLTGMDTTVLQNLEEAIIGYNTP